MKRYEKIIFFSLIPISVFFAVQYIKSNNIIQYTNTQEYNQLSQQLSWHIESTEMFYADMSQAIQNCIDK